MLRLGEIVGAGRAEDDVEVLNGESDEVDGDLEIATEEEQNCIDIAEVSVSVGRSVDVCWQGKEIRLLKDEKKKIAKRLRELVLLSEKNQLPSLRKVKKRTEKNSRTCQ